jgi:hypothetical protein
VHSGRIKALAYLRKKTSMLISRILVNTNPREPNLALIKKKNYQPIKKTKQNCFLG